MPEGSLNPQMYFDGLSCTKNFGHEGHDLLIRCFPFWIISIYIADASKKEYMTAYVP